ncbi:MAG: class I SAM-dependent methyltransferase [Nanoarchaeota archaeon]|nr:class I SAM-dependent methyltransferase [Nanoarchaeota archaeon]
MNNKIKLNLGCGKDYRPGFINVDNSPFVKKDVEHNLDQYPFPFKNSSVDLILAMAVIEHLSDMKSFLEEVHRILKPGGKLRFRVPLAFTHIDAGDCTHKQHLIPRSFKIFMGYNNKYQDITKANFGGEIWITIPFFHKIRFPKNWYIVNFFINNIFTGIEGILIKEDE